MDRIAVTHAGSLIRPMELLAFLSPVAQGRASTDGDEYEAALAKAVAYAVRRQVEAGLDVIDDGEMGKASWITYRYERTSGLESRPLGDGVVTILPPSRDRQRFPGAYRENDLLEREATVRLMREAAEAAVAEQGASPQEGASAEEVRATGTRPGGPSAWACTGPMSYDRAAIDRDLVNFKVALEGSFAQGAFSHRVHEEIQWAKLASLAEGAAIASRELWGPRSEA